YRAQISAIKAEEAWWLIVSPSRIPRWCRPNHMDSFGLISGLCPPGVDSEPPAGTSWPRPGPAT
ncbi:hypothetical protein, partial [Streptomyces shenzhenensis]|uniref:hypothetical protein n=1 Tax=Streptomyces shenzhenensis TaxID=943815 RepID=UPI003408E0DB